MLDPLLSLAFSLHANKGAFAALLGSGVSRSAGIPTGWEIVLDLCRKVASLHGEDASDNPAKWYQTKFNMAPDYSDLLHTLAATPTARQQLLAPYFEPSEAEQEKGLKAPSAAHRALARMAASGHVRVIITTNFDRLMERALEDEGIAPSIVANPSAVAGAGVSHPLLSAGLFGGSLERYTTAVAVVQEFRARRY